MYFLQDQIHAARRAKAAAAFAYRREWQRDPTAKNYRKVDAALDALIAAELHLNNLETRLAERQAKATPLDNLLGRA